MGNKIVKSCGIKKDGSKCGHCYDGTGWVICSFWSKEKDESKCTLWGMNGIKKEASQALFICDLTYGFDYEGDV